MRGKSLPFYLGRLYENRLTRPIKRSIVRSVAVRSGPRAILNRYYSLLDDQARSRFHTRYAKIFRDRSGVQLASGSWTVHFMDREIRLPLRSSWSWLDWDSAVSIVGHDLEIKETYAELIKSDDRPALFLDVGANYGTHSLLFRSVGIPTISFEPNPSCFSYFQAACEMNGFEEGRWEQVAIGDKAGQVELVYPENETWLGSISVDVVSNLRKSDSLTIKQVQLKKIDDYLPDIPHDKILVKIDVEGFEREVIQGASDLLTQYKPKIIFESNNGAMRRDCLELFADYGYSVFSLPWRPSSVLAALRSEEFLTSPATNFIAIAR